MYSQVKKGGGEGGERVHEMVAETKIGLTTLPREAWRIFPGGLCITKHFSSFLCLALPVLRPFAPLTSSKYFRWLSFMWPPRLIFPICLFPFFLLVFLLICVALSFLFFHLSRVVIWVFLYFRHAV